MALAAEPEEGTPLMLSARFRSEREADWRRLEELVTATERRGHRALGFDEAAELATLYRQTVAALSLAREISLDAGLLEYLEALAARAYLAVYAPQESVGGVFGGFLARSGPRALRRSGAFLAAALATLALGIAAGWGLFLDDPAWYDLLMSRPPGDPRGPEATREELLAVIFDTEQSALDGLGAFAAYLFSNNVRVAMLAFAIGALCCWPTFLVVFFNGMSLGAFLALHADRDLLPEIVGWLSIHGVTELGAIVVAAAAGYRLGWAVLFPGPRRRRDALRETAGDALRLGVTAGLMLLAAALLEGFGRQLVQDTGARLAIGWGIGLGWLAWALLAGRSEARA